MSGQSFVLRSTFRALNLCRKTSSGYRDRDTVNRDALHTMLCVTRVSLRLRHARSACSQAGGQVIMECLNGSFCGRQTASNWNFFFFFFNVFSTAQGHIRTFSDSNSAFFIACWLERRTRARKVASSSSGRNGERIFFSR